MVSLLALTQHIGAAGLGRESTVSSILVSSSISITLGKTLVFHRYGCWRCIAKLGLLSILLNSHRFEHVGGRHHSVHY